MPNFFKQNCEVLNNPLDIANGFNDFFAEIGPSLAGKVQNPSGKSFKAYMKQEDTIFRFSSISEVTISDFIRKLKPKTSSGVDCVSNKLLKRIAPLVIGPLHYLINLSLQTGFVPQQMKVSKIIPLYKIDSGDKHDFSNYRPISILSSFAKLVEKIVCSQLMELSEPQRFAVQAPVWFQGETWHQPPLDPFHK